MCDKSLQVSVNREFATPHSDLLADLTAFRACAWHVASVTAGELQAVLGAAARHEPGSAVVATCQRVEVYHAGDCRCGAPQTWTGFDALLRLAGVAAGLDSVLLGEEQILGQVRSALAEAGEPVRHLSVHAVAAARALRAESAFHAHTGHLLDRALELAGVPAHGRIAVVGAGATGRAIAERARRLGFGEIVVVSRRRPEAAWFEGGAMRHHPLRRLADIGPVDVLVTCLGSPADPLEEPNLPAISRLLVDLGTPRNVAGAVRAKAITIAAMVGDDRRSAERAEHRAPLRERLREILEHQLEMRADDSRSYVGHLRLSVERVRQAEVDRILRLHPDLSPATVETISRSLVNQIFHRPTERLRALNDPTLGQQLAGLFADAPEPVGARP